MKRPPERKKCRSLLILYQTPENPATRHKTPTKACFTARATHLKTRVKKISHSFLPHDSFDLTGFQHLHLFFTLSGSFLYLMPADNGQAGSKPDKAHFFPQCLLLNEGQTRQKMSNIICVHKFCIFISYGNKRCDMFIKGRWSLSHLISFYRIFPKQ